ncbi:MAG: choice-of-anchor D domain-containing protein, partial [Gammaproteobacteria bacterium]|nr:choice-of-anchor D domain-containing protein [Gammaproteobacteria bacterium]
STVFNVWVGLSRNVTVVYTPSAAAPDAGTLTITIRDPLGNVFDVPVALAGSGTAAAEADIDVVPLALAFGTVAPGNTANLTTTVSNLGSSDLTVTGLVLSGSADFALAAGAPAVPFTVTAGSSVPVGVDYTPSGGGADSGTLTVQSNDADEPSVVVTLSGEAVPPDITTTPSSLDFGALAVGSTATLTTTVGNIGGTDLTVTAIGVSGSPDFALGAGAPAVPFTVAPGGSVDIPVAYSPAVVGSHAGSLDIASNDPDEPTVAVGLQGSGASSAACDIAANPLALDFGAILIGSIETLTTTMTNTGAADCTVSGVTVTGSSEFGLGPGNPSTPFVVPAGGSVYIAVAYQPADLVADNGTLDISSDDPDSPVINVTLSGTGTSVPPSVCEVAPLSLDFAAVPVGSSVTLTTTVSHNGTSSRCTVQSITSDNPDFSVSGSTLFNVWAGLSRTITVIYTPSAAAADAGTLTITIRDPAGDVFDAFVVLSGSGI